MTIRDTEMTAIHKSPNSAISKYFTDRALENFLTDTDKDPKLVHR